MNETSRTIPSVLAAAIGVAAGLTGLGLTELMTALVGGLTSPLVAVGDRIVDNVPSPITQLAIDLFGTNDKIALFVGLGLTLLLLAAALGVVAVTKSLRLAAIGLASVAVLGAAAATFTRSGVELSGSLPTLVGTAITWAALTYLRSLALLPQKTLPIVDSPQPGDRRSVIAGLLTLSFLGGAGFAVSQVISRNRSARLQSAALPIPTTARTLAPTPTSAQAPGAAPLFTPTTDFYRIDTALRVPQVDVADWSLRIHGMVDEERTLTFDDLVSRNVIESDITLTCVSNTVGGNLVGTARWTGIRLDDLLTEVGIDPAADQIVGRSIDGYTCGFPTSALDGRDALVAFAMNGEPLPQQHGFPARLIVPGLYGYVSATKWLTEIELTRFSDFDHFWVSRGYSALGPIKLQSRIDTPRGLDRIDAGMTVIGGVAWAQPIGISRVELSIDEGPWMDAQLADEVNGSVWRQWSFPWEATPGRHSITVRATDSEGNLQTEDRQEPLPNGATGRHTVIVLVNE